MGYGPTLPLASVLEFDLKGPEGFHRWAGCTGGSFVSGHGTPFFLWHLTRRLWLPKDKFDYGPCGV